MRIVVLPGDCIGPELTAEATRALAALVPGIELEQRPFGAAAIRACGDPLPDATLSACRGADAVLKGPIGDPEFDAAEVRPEQGLLRLREALDVYANLRPARRGEVDLLIVRELVGGLYFGARGVRDDGTAFDTCEYHPAQVERIARRAFELARERRRRVTSVDKANVLETSRLWRRVVSELAAGYPDVELDHMLVDNCAMQLVQAPGRFDVILTENMFGDILSDEASAVSGGLGLAGSASLGDAGPGLFEPVHGSAPELAGRGIANPAGMLRSTALLLAHGLGLPEQARRLDAAVDRALEAAPPPDLGGSATTREIGDAVLAALARDA
ncbi:MAG: 3-isopropylmalate dehydrogenase [Thermoleophilia bacterium]|nr:3-isopropylmalate dehydrogenase [Thermoleophilia bacterium]